MTFADKVFYAVMKIPAGKVATYGEIAKSIGLPNASRAVGSTLHKNDRMGFVPIHRVVNNKGVIASNTVSVNPAEQKKLLEQEGVKIKEGGSVSLAKYACTIHVEETKVSN